MAGVPPKAPVQPRAPVKPRAPEPPVQPSQSRNYHDKASEPIRVDPKADISESGSDYETGSSEYSTDSLTSSIYKYRFENGRRYHAYKDGKYALPNDENEQERLDIVHHIFLILLDDKLHLAPIDPKPQRILDVGTGTGIWAIDAADRYPSAEVIGTDLSPIQPSWVPQNVHFQIDDAESEWTFAQNSFDLVHIRHLNGSIKDWQALLIEAYKATKPGGWISVTEYEMDLWSDDGTLLETSPLKKFYRLMNEAAEKTGREFKIATSLKPIIEKAGFVKSTHLQMKTAVGTWPADKKQKEIGAYAMLTSEHGFESFGLAFLTRVLEMDTSEVTELIAKSKKDFRNKKIHAYSKQHIYYAQKPSDP